MFTQVSQGVYVRAEGTLQKQHALNQRSPARSGIENRWSKGKAKVKGRSCLYELLGPFRACGIYLRNLLNHDLIRLAVSLHDVQTLLQTMGAETLRIVVFCVGITADGVEVVNGGAAIVLSDAQFSSCR